MALIFPIIVFHPPHLKLRPALVLIDNYFFYKAFLLALIWILIVTVLSAIPSKKTHQKTTRNWSCQTVFFCIIVFTILGTIGNYVYYFAPKSYPIYLKQVLLALKWLSASAVILSFYYLTSIEKTKLKWGIYFFILLNFTVIIFTLLTGATFFILDSFLATLYSLIAMRSKPRTIILFFIFAFLISACVLSLKTSIRITRSEIKRAGYQPPIIPKIKLLKNSLAHDRLELEQIMSRRKIYNKFNTNQLLSFINFTFLRILTRLDHLSEFSYVVQESPKNIKFIHGKTYYPLLSLPIPRIIWKEKPIILMGQYYGQRYGFSWPHYSYRFSKKVSSNIGLPMVIEGWINFGYLGVLLSAIVFGVLVRMLWKHLITENPQIGDIFISSIMVATLSITDCAYRAIGTSVQLLIIFLFFEYIIRYVNDILKQKRLMH